MVMPTLRQTGRPAICPFCEARLPRPKPRPWNTLSLLPGGKCDCGAFFVVDPTGRNGGHALLEVLEDICGGDRDRSLRLERGRDYGELIANYDPQLHQYLQDFKGYRRGMARLYLAKLLPAAAPPA